MKEVLESYIDAIGEGKTLPELFDSLELSKGKKIRGFPVSELLSKLDLYLQSLYSDERELLLYREECERPLSVHSSPGVRVKRKLLY